MSSDDTTEISTTPRCKLTRHAYRLSEQKSSKSGQHTPNDIAQFLSSRFIRTHMHSVSCTEVCIICNRDVSYRQATYNQLYRASVQIQFGVSNFEGINWVTAKPVRCWRVKLSCYDLVVRCNIACVRCDSFEHSVSFGIGVGLVRQDYSLFSGASQGCVSVERCERETRKFCICVMFRDIQVTAEIHGGRGQGRGKRKTYWKEMADSLW